MSCLIYGPRKRFPKAHSGVSLRVVFIVIGI